MRTRLKTQRGVTFWGILTGAVLLGFVVTLALKLGPAYVRYWTLTSIMDDIAHSTEPLEGGKQEILARIDRRLEVNDLGSLGNDIFSVQPGERGGYELKADYEQRIHLFFNVDAVLSFDRTVSVPGR